MPTRALSFLRRSILLTVSGRPMYYVWMTALAAMAWIGGRTFFYQLAHGMSATSLSDQIPWGVYNANFTYLVGLAVSSVLLVIPAYIYRHKDMQDVVLIGGLLAIATMIMSLLFVIVAVGRPERLWHLIPFLGTPNFPSSMLAWDVISIVGYLAVNVFVCCYFLYMKYLGRRPKALVYLPFVALSIAWAVSIHLVTVYLYAGLVGREFWSAGIVAPRFLGSAFTAGPGILIIAFYVIRRFTRYDVSQHATDVLRYIVTASLLLNIFLLSCETIRELYAAPGHVSSTRYLFLGLDQLGHYYMALVPWIWTAMALQIIAGTILVIPAMVRRAAFLNIACVLAIVGIWIEKGMGMVVAGFVPSPLGIVVEYHPSWIETMVALGIWSFGLLMFSWMVHLAIPILSGAFRSTEAEKRIASRAEGEIAHPVPQAVPAIRA